MPWKSPNCHRQLTPPNNTQPFVYDLPGISKRPLSYDAGNFCPSHINDCQARAINRRNKRNRRVGKLKTRARHRVRFITARAARYREISRHDDNPFLPSSPGYGLETSPLERHALVRRPDTHRQRQGTNTVSSDSKAYFSRVRLNCTHFSLLFVKKKK